VIRYLSRSDIEGLGITGVALADAIEDCLRAAAAGAATNVPKSGVQLDDGRLFQSILAVGHGVPAPLYAATKVVGLAPDNHARGLPHIGSVIVLLDGETGQPAGLMDGSWITERRTAALSLVAARRLAVPASSRIGFVACGAQARAHLEVFAEVFPLTSVAGISRQQASAEAFADFARERGFTAEACDAPRAAVAESDIVITSVPAGTEPLGFLDPGWLKPGSFASFVDLGRSWRDDGFADFAHLVVDDREQASKSGARRKITPAGPFTADIGELVNAAASADRAPEDRAIFVFQGLALADLAAAVAVHEAAEAADAGVMLER